MPTQALPFHLLAYGDSGGGKSHLAATAPLPSIVCLFDGLGKAMPYFTVPKQFVARKRVMPYTINGKPAPLTTAFLFDPSDTERTHPQRIIYDLSEAEVIDNPTSWQLFYEVLFPTIDKTMASINASTLILDSITTLQNAYHAYYEKWLKKTESWWDMANPLTNKLQWLCMMLAAKQYNTVIICHIEQKSKSNVHGYAESVPNMRGRMGEQGSGAVVLHDNVWRVYAKPDGTHAMQCINDGRYIANNNVNAPLECENDTRVAMRNAPAITWED